MHDWIDQGLVLVVTGLVYTLQVPFIQTWKAIHYPIIPTYLLHITESTVCIDMCFIVHEVIIF